MTLPESFQERFHLVMSALGCLSLLGAVYQNNIVHIFPKILR